MDNGFLRGYLAECRDLVLSEIQEIVPHNRYRPILYDLILDYPLRVGKAFRPSLCIATCRALGGRVQDVLRTAAVLELFHNAFLVHDDIEDESLMRRGLPTLHLDYGVPIAINVGDGIFALCLQPLLDNARLLGLGKALRILEIVARMARESVEGQAIELDWIRRRQWHLRDRDYCRLSYKKTCWYSFIAPMQIGAVVAGALPAQLAPLRKYAAYVGVAFQIQDDVLNLTADEDRYGKEIGGDLWEGKHTLIVMHMMRCASEEEQTIAQKMLAKPRGGRTEEDVQYLLDLIARYGSLDYAREVALALACKAEQVLERAFASIPPSVHRDFLQSMTQYVTTREK
ncbi:MAG: polyprenyl synthetase family protein [Anaerolineae bacterium]|nr:polyprenyl synthetase family protein [Anaerolineae bacterium]